MLTEKGKIIKKPSNLSENQKIQDELFRDISYGEPRQKFCYFVGKHPRLYDGVDLDMATINYINNYFYDYYLDPRDFERHFILKLQRVAPIYNNLKKIEFDKRVFDITTNYSFTKSVENITNDLTRDGTLSSVRGENMTITDNGTVAENGSGTSRENVSSDSESNSRKADRQLPMQSNGDDFDDVVNWDRGASAIGENRDESNSSETTNANTTTTNNTITNNTTTRRGNITKDDTQNLKELANRTLNNKNDYEAVNKQAVELIKKIWNYLVEPKSLDYITSELETCFSLIL